MIKAVILDVDGVVVGDRPGVNFPLPHTKVLERFKKVRASGTPLVLCTAKFGYAVQGIIRQAHLDNSHITDGGALVIDPFGARIVKKHVIDKAAVVACLVRCLEENLLVELYTPEAYYIQRSQFSEFVTKRSKVLQLEPTLVESLRRVAEEQDIIKLIVFSGEADASKVDELTAGLGDSVTFTRTMNPFLQPMKIGIITAPGVSKAHAAQETADNLGVGFDEILGIGDTAGDWNFMQLCAYVATLENGDAEIKRLVQTKGEGHYFIAPHLDDNGILDILDNFGL